MSFVMLLLLLLQKHSRDVKNTDTKCLPCGGNRYPGNRGSALGFGKEKEHREMERPVKIKQEALAL